MGAAETTLADWVEFTAEEDFDALRSYGGFLSQVGRAEDALHYLQKASNLKPNLAPPLIQMSMASDALDQPDRAEELGKKARSLTGYMAMFSAPRFWRLLAAGDHTGARDFYIDMAVAIGGRDRGSLDEIVETRELPADLNAFGRLWATSVLNFDDFKQGLEHLQEAYRNPELDSGAGMLNIALFAAHFGDINLSVQALRRSLHFERATALAFSWSPIMRPVRRHEEFKALLQDLDIVDYWHEWGWPEHCRPLSTDDFACN